MDLRVFREIKAAPDLRANRAFPGLRVPPDLKVNKEYKDPKGISGLRVKKVKLGLRAKKARLGLRENRAFRGSKAKKGIPVKRPQLQLSKIRLSAIN